MIQAKSDHDYEERVLKMENMKKAERKVVRTPVPNPRHNLCQVCNAYYKNYKEHINSELHNQAIQGDPIYMKIDFLIKELNIKMNS